MFTQGTYYKFGRNVFIFSLVHRLLPAFLAVIVVVIGQIFLPIGYAVGFLLLIILAYAAIIALSVWYGYAYHSFKLDEYALVIRSGIMNRREISIPYRQIQDVDMNQNYGERVFHVAELMVLTSGNEDKGSEAGKEESSAIFPHIDHVYAVELSRELMKRAGVEEVVEEKPVK